MSLPRDLLAQAKLLATKEPSEAPPQTDESRQPIVGPTLVVARVRSPRATTRVAPTVGGPVSRQNPRRVKNLAQL